MAAPPSGKLAKLGIAKAPPPPAVAPANVAPSALPSSTGKVL